MKTELQAIRGYYRRNPALKVDPVKEETTFQLWDGKFGCELEAALREALAVGERADA